MCDAFGIINFEDSLDNIGGMLNYRSLAAISFLGRYRLVDFVLSNMTNSEIENIQLYIKNKPRSIIEHVGTGSHFNINSKRGRLRMLYNEGSIIYPTYNNDITAFRENLRFIEENNKKYVVIAPSYMIYSINFNDVIADHIENGSDITIVYKNITNGKTTYIGCDTLIFDYDKRVGKIEKNLGKYKNRNISLETYIMSKETFLNLIERSVKISSLFTLRDIISDSADELTIHGYSQKGYAACVNDLYSYYHASMQLLEYGVGKEIFKPDWPVYTKTNDSPPTRYTDSANIRKSIVANGCLIEGEVVNSIIGRNVIIRKGASVYNSVLLAESYIGEDVQIEHAVVDKQADIRQVKSIIGTHDHPAYIKRNDRI